MAGMRAVDPRVSFAELARWPDDGRRYELYGGEPIVVPAPLPIHQRVVIAIVDLLTDYERAMGGLVFCSPIDIVLSDYDVLQPDVVWFGSSRMHLVEPHSAIESVPDLAIEVLSRTTEARDRGRKLDLLGRFDLPEYWIIDPVECRLEVYTNRNGRMLLACDHQGNDEVISPTVPHLRFTVDRLFRLFDRSASR
jgi:Uma2 family endonuclease